MATYCLRAEAKIDIDTFLAAMVSAQLPVSRYVISCTDIDSVVIEFDTPASLEAVLDCIRTVPDGHVMYRTVRDGVVAGCDFAEVRVDDALF